MTRAAGAVPLRGDMGVLCIERVPALASCLIRLVSRHVGIVTLAYTHTRLYTRTTDEQLIRVVLAISYEEDE